MQKILFINACVRGSEISRTHWLCREFLKEYQALNPDVEVITLNLEEENLKPYHSAMLDQRNQLLKENNRDHEIFRYARQFAAADKIVIGAPYWDLSFPAVLKVYIEHVAVSGITFCYTEDGEKGLCRADKMMYITTTGGYINSADFGYEYFKGLCRMFGIGGLETVRGEGLDIEGASLENILQEAKKEAIEAARLF